MESIEVINGVHKEDTLLDNRPPSVEENSNMNNNDDNKPSPDPEQSANGGETQTLSKRQQKKLLRRQKWNDTKVERRKREREKLKKRLVEKRAAGEPCGNIRKKLKQMTMASSSCKQRVVVDMSFDDLMIEKHLSQCVKQVSRCYSANRRVSSPMQLYVTSFEGKCAEVMSKQNGYEHWDVYFKKENYMDLFPKEDIIYLTSESRNVITSVEENKVYVIGGLVDHNVHKGLCLRLAEEKGIAHGRLPIDEFIEMKTRKVLTIDHVFRIILGVTEGGSWKESFLKTIPARKGAVGKDEENDCEDSELEKDATNNSDDKSEDNPSESREPVCEDDPEKS